MFLIKNPRTTRTIDGTTGEASLLTGMALESHTGLLVLDEARRKRISYAFLICIQDEPLTRRSVKNTK